ncbi:hypothetical protein ACA910_017592 [Epithemia clementina (nom. ined.)]
MHEYIPVKWLSPEGWFDDAFCPGPVESSSSSCARSPRATMREQTHTTTQSTPLCLPSLDVKPLAKETGKGGGCDFYCTSRGSSGEIRNKLMHSSLPCKSCRHPVQPLLGNICVNYGHTRGTTLRCDGRWPAKCYQQHKNDHFPVLKAAELDDALLDVDDPGELVNDPKRFKESRPGNFLMCSFQCDCCAFYNVKMRYPSETSTKDQLLLNCIRRANLDAFWSRERSTVSKNRLEMAGFLRSADTLGIDWAVPERGPFPLGDTMGMGMGTACAMLVKTLQAGRNADCIQFETAQKVRSTVLNLIHTTPFGAGASTIGTSDWDGLFFLGSPTNSLWFRRFMLGCHRCMGDMWILDRATTLEVVTGSLELLEEEYSSVRKSTTVGGVLDGRNVDGGIHCCPKR